MPTLKDALDMASPSFSKILDELKPDLVIHDYIQNWAPIMAKSRNIPAVHFCTSSASMMCFLLHMAKDHTKPFPYPGIMPRNFKNFVSRTIEPSSEDYAKEDRRFMGALKGSDFILIKSLKELEGKNIDLFLSLIEKKIVPAGPLVESPIDNGDESSEIIEWLDKKDKASTVFVSFGSECFLTKEELKEVADGLELSNLNFIWLIRHPAGEKINVNDALPEGFLERVGKRGKIVEGWVPQMKILAHSSVGGFVSHCGWGSIMESIKLGVPIIPVPMHIDQPFNARLLEEIGVALEMKRAENGGLIGAEIAKAIRKVLLEKDGEGVRKKVKQFGDILSWKDETEIDGLVEELLKLCKGNVQFVSY